MSNTYGLFQQVKRWVAQALADFEGDVVSTGDITAANITDSALTSGRVVIAGTGGLLADDAGFTFSTATLTATNIVATTGLTNSALTAGRVPIVSTGGLLADDADFTFSTATLTATNMVVTTALTQGASGSIAAGSGGISTTGTLAATGAFTPTGGIVGTTLGRITNIPIGDVAYGSLGTNTTLVAGTQYFAEVWLPANKTITGVAVLNGATVGADNGLVFLCNSAGTVVATSALAGAATAGANAFQQRNFTAPYAAVGPGRYWLGYQSNGTTDTIRTIAADTFLNYTGSAAGVFGTVPAITPTTSTTADVGPAGYLY